MGLWDKLGQASDYLRKKRLSLGPDSYFQYKRERKRERKHARERAESLLNASATTQTAFK
jgi:hypothetical protein